MNSTINQFNVRVYFLLLDESKGLLVSDEIIRGNHYTKLPGGGLEFGESPVEAAMREAVEELGQEIEVIDHFYTTDIFVQSQFNPAHQIIAIYYEVRLKEDQRFRTSEQRFDFRQTIDNEESFRWVRLENLSSDDFSFPTDRAAIDRLLLLNR
jgi:8-oxo-dGTP diphosphatase